MNNQIQLQQFDANAQGRDFAVGDIHGHFTQLMQGLQTIGFDPDRDRLFSLGDLVDRGPESHLAPEWLARPWFHAIRGNHEAMTCDAVGGDAEAVHFHRTHGGDWLDSLTPEVAGRMREALASLPLAIEVATAQGPVGLVHADLPTDDWSDVRERPLSAHEAAHCIWSRQRHHMQYTGQVRHVRAVVHGHVTLARMAVLGNVYFIDTHGGRADGYFTFLELGALKVHPVPGPRRAPVPRRNR